MAQTHTVEIEFLEDDARAVVHAAGGHGPDLPRRLAVLLAEGLAQYVRDEAEWEAQAAAGSGAGAGAQAPLLVLKRREAEALVVSMRARTIASERRLEALKARVCDLAREHAEYRGQMARLRAAAGRLRRQRARLRTALHGGAPASAAPSSLAAKLAARLGAMVRRGAPR
jgi:cell division protein FtsB